MPAITKASLDRRRHPRNYVGSTDNNHNLLGVILVAAFLMAVGVVYVPISVDNDTLQIADMTTTTTTSTTTTTAMKTFDSGRSGASLPMTGKKSQPVLQPILLNSNSKEAKDGESEDIDENQIVERIRSTKTDASNADESSKEQNNGDSIKNKKSNNNNQITMDLPDYQSNNAKNDAYHTVFSTGCSTFQDWQSYVFFYHILHSGQEGPVTRIVSGCNEEDAQTLTDIFENEIAVMAPPGRFRLHFTPDFSQSIPGKNFKYFNKPFGMRHWMQEVLGYPDNHDSDDTIIILLDPDQILIRPFTNDFTHSSEKWRLKDGFKLKVEHGSPFSQQYGYGIQWKRKTNPEQVFQGHSPVADMTEKEAADYYAGMGPPYVATGKDMYTIVRKWAEVVPRVHNDYPHLLAEMFAFNLAAAHEGLRHTIAHSFMVSDVYAGGEGWQLIDKVPNEDICHHFPKSEYPHVIHYCQRYYLGKWFIGKYKLRKDFISCDAPLLVMPPEDLATQGYTSAILPAGDYKELKPKHAKEQAFMVCTMIRALNEAAVYYKDHHCDKASANYEYSYVFHRNMTMPDRLER